MKRKVYPDWREIQRKTQAVTGVLNSLAELSISVNHIDMSAQEPVIKIDHCPGAARTNWASFKAMWRLPAVAGSNGGNSNESTHDNSGRGGRLVHFILSGERAKPLFRLGQRAASLQFRLFWGACMTLLIGLIVFGLGLVFGMAIMVGIRDDFDIDGED